MTDWEDLLRDDLSEAWNPDRFNRTRLPVAVGQHPAITPAGEITSIPSCLDMLVKLPGHSDLIVPDRYTQNPDLAHLLTLMHADATTRTGCTPKDRYAYLTVDARIVTAGRTHRNKGWHFDGMQGARYPEPLPVCYQYVWASTLATEYASGPTDATGLNVLTDNWFAHLGAQVNDADITTYPSDTILLMSAYQLHRSPTATTTTPRLLVRLDYSHKQQDRLGNTINENLPAPFAYVPRSMPEGLGTPIDDTGWPEQQH